jgi:hypothetical protein
MNMPQGLAYRQPLSLGQVPTAPAPVPIPQMPGFVEVPAFYTATVILGGATNDVASNAVALRPERFELRRITWATQADAFPFVTTPAPSSIQGRCVEVTWGDEFTQFLGNQPALLSALFGDTNGFLDLPQGILFQGRQSLNVKLKRLQWPDADATPAPARFDIVFHGVGLLPAGTGGVSGSL